MAELETEMIDASGGLQGLSLLQQPFGNLKNYIWNLNGAHAKPICSFTTQTFKVHYQTSGLVVKSFQLHIAATVFSIAHLQCEDAYRRKRKPVFFRG